MFSISGYDPCPEYKIDFTNPNGFDLKYFLICQRFDETGFNVDTTENVGYGYRDVVIPPVIPPFQYIASNQETKYSIINAEPVQIQVAISDWKWLSN
jgi:hypothetical protein